MTEASSSSTASSTPSELDLAFIIDATGSMGTYIKSAQDNMQKIIHDIIVSERCQLNVALILYRDHPPQDSSFVIQLHDFTNDVEQAKTAINSASAAGGGDGPEAIAPALHAAVHTLSWRKNAVKIALLIADAPPHGLDRSGDHWPDGDPSGHDPMASVTLMGEQSITLYSIGCEPAVTPYRDFFMAIAFKTGGQYIPLGNCADLATIIVGSAREEISLERLIAQVHEEVMREAASRGGPVNEAELTRRLHEVMKDGGAKVRRLKLTNGTGAAAIPALTKAAEDLSTLSTLKEVQDQFAKIPKNTTSLFPLFTLPAVTPTLPIRLGKVRVRTGRTLKKPRTRTPVVKKTAVKRKATPTVVAPTKKKPRPTVARGNRRSARLALSGSDHYEDEEVATDELSSEDEATKTPPPPPPKKRSVKRPAKMEVKVSMIDLEDDELLDISHTRRLVRKCVARNKLKST